MTYSSTLHAHTSSQEHEYLEGWKRSRAELENLRARLHVETEEAKERITRNVLEDMIAIADNFQALVQHVPEDKKDDPWTQGVLHIARHFMQTLEGYGVEIINPKDQHFNPELHEAVEQIEGEGKESGDIAHVLQVGYRLNKAVIRPAKVQVFK